MNTRKLLIVLAIVATMGVFAAKATFDDNWQGYWWSLYSDEWHQHYAAAYAYNNGSEFYYHITDSSHWAGYWDTADMGRVLYWEYMDLVFTDQWDCSGC